MAPSKEQKDLLIIETKDFTLILKGPPYDDRYLSLKEYRNLLSLNKDKMFLRIVGEKETVKVYDVSKDSLVDYDEGSSYSPIFFENGIYQLVIISKTSNKIDFYHEYSEFRKAISQLDSGKNRILLGLLDFRNEIGYSTFSIKKDSNPVLDVTIEIFPTKLTYKQDFQNLLQEVNDEIYNLAYHFIRKTFITGSTISSKKPSPAEFYRLLEYFFRLFIKAIQHIERFPHHQLEKEYEFVRGEKIRKTDQKTIKHFRTHPNLLFVADSGIEIRNTSYFIDNSVKVLPIKGLNVKKTITFDTLENRFVKWMILRVINKLTDLLGKIENEKATANMKAVKDQELINRIQSMKEVLTKTLRKPFWMQISKLEKTVLNLVIQMKTGYRDAYKIYLTLMKGISLQGEILKMSLKDVATLYEYWTYLKIGQILRKQYNLEEQTIIKVKDKSLFVHLGDVAPTRLVFTHPYSKEKIKLIYQNNNPHLPTVQQIPDITMEIYKKDLPYPFIYIFDAKYRINFDDHMPSPGPMVEDINTMHRYRDALVVKNEGPYERFAFGAYVLFPWHDEDNYENHPFYKSIDVVNIGGFPFLPNTSKLLERFIERLIDSNPEELQEEGILPRGSITYWESKLEEKVIVININQSSQYKEAKQNGIVKIKLQVLGKGWEKAKYIALYITQPLAKELNIDNGIRYFSEINDLKILKINEEIFVQFELRSWNILPNVIRPVGYGINTSIITTINLLKESNELPELFMKFGEEKKLWRMLRRLSSNVSTILDSKILDRAKKINAYQIGFYSVDFDIEKKEIHVTHDEQLLGSIPLKKLEQEPNAVFKMLKEIIFQV